VRYEDEGEGRGEDGETEADRGTFAVLGGLGAGEVSYDEGGI
jgi:hypothetical protein